MKITLILLSLVVSGSNAVFHCNTQPEFVYEIPEGFKVINTFERNGLLSAGDKYGNGIDIYADFMANDFDIDMEVCLLKRSMDVIDEKDFDDGSYRAWVDNKGPIDPYSSIVIVPNNGLVLRAYFFKLGEPWTHGAFEEKSMQLVRSIAPGGKDGKAWKDCVVDVLRSDVGRQFGES